MKKYKFYCPNCGWKTMLEEDYLEQGERCSMCGHMLILDEHSLDALVADDIERGELENMRTNIETYGNDVMWYKIERAIDNPYFRLKFRKRFFAVGGVVPMKGMKI